LITGASASKGGVSKMGGEKTKERLHEKAETLGISGGKNAKLVFEKAQAPGKKRKRGSQLNSKKPGLWVD